jgi:hypothetical protein
VWGLLRFWRNNLLLLRQASGQSKFMLKLRIGSSVF